MPYALDGNPSPSEVSEAINYLLSNFATGINSDAGTGQIIGPTGGIVGYLYQYMAVKYADSFDGTVNFSNTPTGRLYYGLRNTNDATESSNPVDYIWYKVTGGFGSTKFLWYISNGGRQIQFAISTAAPDVGWIQDSGASIDLDVITSGSTPVIAQQFVPYFTPAILQVPRSGSPLAPSFTGITPTMYASNGIAIVPFTDAQTDSNVAFVNNSWRIGNSSTTGYGDISLTNITIGNPTDGGDYALWPTPTAMSSSPAFITVPVRYKDGTGTVSQAGVATIQLIFADPGAAGSDGPNVDISGYTTFVENAGGAFNPATATLSAIYPNVSSPTFSWAITGATPSSSTASSVVITPLSAATNVVVTLTVDGTNLATPISKTINMPVVYDGAPGEAGSNGVMSAFPTIYQWTGSSTPPARPTTTSTYTWGTGTFTAPTGWYSSAPSNTVAGNFLWSITVPLNEPATAVTTVIDWTNVTYPIRAIAYNGANGANGDNGDPGSAGAATFVVTRFANDSSPPTNAEVNAVIGRNPVAGDIVTVSYNNFNNAVVYRYVTSWVLFTTYITGSLIVENTITGNKMVANTITAAQIAANTITANELSSITVSASKNIKVGTAAVSGTTMTGSGGILNGDGTFALGNSTTNISYNGTQMTLNGNVVNTANIAANAVTNVVYAYSSSSVSLPENTWTNILNVTITTIGGPILVSTQGSQIAGTTDEGAPSAPFFRLVRGSTVLINKPLPSGLGAYGQTDAGMAFAETIAAGTYTYYLQGNVSPSGNNDAACADPFISVTELKR
jgi:hypothetical protein